MNKISGRIIVHETERPMPSLLVHFYSLPKKALPETIHDESQWDKLYANEWSDLGATRLGSVQTTVDGRIYFEYDPALVSLPTNANRINLWFVIVGPEITGADFCPKVLHVGCDIRADAGVHESFVVRIPRARLVRHGIEGGITPRVSESFATSELYSHLDNLSKVTFSPDIGNQPFSNHFKKKLQQHKKEISDQGLIYSDKSAFSITLPLRNPEMGELAEGTKIEFDRSINNLVVKSNGQSKPLKYGGVVRQEATAAKSLKQNRPFVQIDEQSGEFKLVLLNVPDALRITDNESGKLYEFYRQRTQGLT